MRKREQEALRRLEAALLRQEETEDDMQVVEHTWQELSAGGYDVYNSDISDVDMDAFSEDVHRGRRKRPFRSLFRLLLFAAALWILLRFLGVI